MDTDAELLRRYVQNGDEAAFTEVVDRHLHLVYATACREASDAAQDVTQLVFIELARKASRLTSYAAISGWLYTSVRYVSANHRRARHRRAARETMAHAMKLPSNPADIGWQDLCPVLDDALHELNESDRNAVVMRFLEGSTFQQIGAALNLKENAARMRVDRAVEKLRLLLAKRGVTSTASGLIAALGSGLAASPPSTWAATVASAALAQSALSTVATTSPLAGFLAMTKLKTTIVSAILAVGVATPFVLQHQSHSKLRAEKHLLQQQVGQLTADKQRLSNLEGPTRVSPPLSNEERTELLRLRGEVARLRTENRELANVKTLPPPVNERPAQMIPQVSWANAGTATPEAALQTYLWAAKIGDSNALSRVIRSRTDDGIPVELAQTLTRSQFGSALKTFSNLSAIQILGQRAEAPDATRMRLEFTEDNGRKHLREIYLLRDTEGWKPALNIQRESKGSFSAQLLLPLTPELGAID